MIHHDSDAAGIEQHLSSLHAQSDGARIPNLPDEGAAILKRWAAITDRHAKAVSQLEAHLRELGDANTRLQQDASQRLQDLERIIQHEWNALRDLHEAPVRQLVEQAARLTEVCIATANAAQHGFDHAEARLATLEADFHRATSELSRDVHAVLAEVRHLSTTGPRQVAGEAPTWPLEGVTRLHEQLRRAGGHVAALPAADPRALPAEFQSIDPVTTHRDRPVPQAQPEVAPADAANHRGFLRIGVIAATIAVIAIVGVLGWRLQRDVRAAAEQAAQDQRQARAAVEAATRQAAQREEAAARQLGDARELASKAQTISDVLAAPDLIRYSLVGTTLLPTGAGQLLWSRSRGVVFSGSGFPPPPPNSAYQIWVLTRTGAVSVGTFTPDAGGRATMTANLNVPRPVVGGLVTMERKEGAATPTSEPLLARLPPAPPPQ